MAQVKIRVYQNNNTYSNAYGKFYGRVQHSTEIDVPTLCAHVAMDSGVEQAQVAIVFDAVAKQMKEQLCNGHPIKVEGIGTFKIGIQSEGWGPEEVRKIYKNFDPETEDIRKYLSARQVKKAYVLFMPTEEVKQMLRSVKFETDKTEWASLLKKEKEAADQTTEEPETPEDPGTSENPEGPNQGE